MDVCRDQVPTQLDGIPPMNSASPFTFLQGRLVIGGGVLLVVFLGWAAANRAAQDPEPGKQPPKQRMEEEDNTPAKPPQRKIRFEEEDPNAKTKLPGANLSGDFNQLARDAKDSAVQELYQKLAVPFDQVIRFRNTDNSTYPQRAVPLDQYYGGDQVKKPATLSVTSLDEANKPGKAEALSPATTRRLIPMNWWR